MCQMHGYIEVDGVKVPNPGRHLPTAGNHRLRRVRVVKDADGKTLKGKGGGARRKPIPHDGEVLADKVVMHAMARKAAKNNPHTKDHQGNPFPGSLGTSVFAADARDIQAPRIQQEKHSRGLIALLAAALATGALSLDDLYASHDARTVRRVLAHKPGH